MDSVHETPGRKWAVSVSGCSASDPSAMGRLSIRGDGFVLVPPHPETSSSTAHGQLDVRFSSMAVAMQTNKLPGPDFLYKAYCTQLFLDA